MSLGKHIGRGTKREWTSQDERHLNLENWVYNEIKLIDRKKVVEQSYKCELVTRKRVRTFWKLMQ
jgi:hypothetical protein